MNKIKNNSALKRALGLSLLAAASLVLAEDTAFTTHTELGYVSTSGNTNTKSGSVDFVGKQKIDKHSLQFDIDYLYGEQEGIETNNKFITSLNYDYQFAEDFAFNYIISYKNDKFSGFDYQFYTGPGLIYDAVKTDAHTLHFQGNIVYAIDEGTDKYYDALGVEIKYPYINPPIDPAIPLVPGVTNEYASYLLQGNYVWKVTETFKFLQDLSYRSEFGDTKNYFVYSKTAVSSKINGNFSMGLSYKVDYTNMPPVGNEYTDKTFTAALIIDY